MAEIMRAFREDLKESKEIKFYVHVSGPDDLLPFRDELLALKYANEINKIYVNEVFKYNDCPICVAIVKSKAEIDKEMEA